MSNTIRFNELAPAPVVSALARWLDASAPWFGPAAALVAALALFALPPSATPVIGALLASGALCLFAAGLWRRRDQREGERILERIATQGSAGIAPEALARLSGAQGEALRQLVARLAAKRTEIDALQAELAQLEAISASLRVGIMVADANGTVVQANDCAREIFSALASDDAWAALPGSLEGVDLRGLAPEIEGDGRQEHELRFAGRAFRLLVDPLLDPQGQRLGTVVVWEDHSAERALEEEMVAIVANAASGGYGRRVDASGHNVYMQALAEQVNALLQVGEHVTGDMLRVFGALACGDLHQTLEKPYTGSFAKLKDDANTTVARLREVVDGMRDASASVHTAFREISQGNMDLSHRTEQQAASLEETASSIDELTGTVQQNADHARQASELVLRAREQAVEGGAVVGKAVAAMAEINDASVRIADIIRVIDEIAFQTNLLALNASVEAARAGDHGRGFAVVAGEVRSLAGRSAEAAKEIKHLIEDSVQKVRRGTDLVHESGANLESIVARVQQVTDIVSGISTASNEQALGIAQVNATIGQLDDMTQQNAALVEEVSAASELAGEQAERLQEMIRFFDAGTDGHGEASRVAHDAPRQGLRLASAAAAPAASTVLAMPSVAAPGPLTTAAAEAADEEWEEF